MTSFDIIHERKGTGSEKWDMCDTLFKGEDLLPLWVADMDFRVPEQIRQALHKRIDHGIFGYSTYTDSTYQSVINWFSSRHKWTIEKDWIVFSPGVVPAINILIQSLPSTDDAILIQRPVYYPFMKVIESNGRRVVSSSLVQDSSGRYVMDFDDLESKIEENGVKTFILCSPHNPVGRVWQEEELSRLLEVCRKHDVLIISDEIHCDLIYRGHRHIPLQTIAKDYRDNIITCTAPSKTFNLAGLQTSNIIIPDKIKRKKFRLALLQNALMDPNSLGPVAMEAAYNNCAWWVDELMLYIEENLNFLKEFVKNRLPGVRVIEPEGTYLLWLDFRDVNPDHEEMTRLLIEKAGVAPDPGQIFGEEGNGFHRLNLACPRELLEKGLERISEALNQE